MRLVAPSVLLVFVACAQHSPPEPSIKVVSAGQKPRFELSSAKESLEPKQQLSLHFQDREQAIMVKYSQKGKKLVMQPVFQLLGGKYRINYLGAQGDQRYFSFEQAQQKLPPLTKLVGIYPQLSKVPANQLRFYVCFSEGMEGGKELFEYFSLVDLATDQEVEAAFRSLELWSKQRRCLTLLLHPGRVKSGIGFSNGLGPVLQQGRRYSLRIKDGLKDRHGRVGQTEGGWDFAVVAPDLKAPSVQDLRLEAPRGPSQPLKIFSQQTIDMGALAVGLSISDAKGEALEGEFKWSRESRRAFFYPVQRWQPGKYQLKVSRYFQDPSGNQLGLNFEHKVAQPPSETEQTISFTVPGP